MKNALSATNIFDPAFGADPFAFYQEALAEAPVLHLPAVDTWLVVGAEEITEVCARFEDFSNDISVVLSGTHADNPEVSEKRYLIACWNCEFKLPRVTPKTRLLPRLSELWYVVSTPLALEVRKDEDNHLRNNRD